MKIEAKLYRTWYGYLLNVFLFLVPKYALVSFILLIGLPQKLNNLQTGVTIRKVCVFGLKIVGQLNKNICRKLKLFSLNPCNHAMRHISYMG